MFLLTLIVDFIVYRYYLKNKIFNGIFDDTIQQIMFHISKRVSVGVVGNVDSDKSSVGTLFTQVSELRNLGLLQEQYEKLKIVLSFLDFDSLNNYFMTDFDTYKVYTTEDYHHFALDSLNATGQMYLILKNDLEEDIKEIQFEPFTKTSADKLLALYFEDMYYLFLRQTHVLSNTPIMSVNTGNKSLPMMETLIQLYNDNELAFEKWLVINEDEKGITDNSRISSKRDKESIKENEDGKDAYFMILRHLSEGTNVHININQRVEDVSAFMRRLYQIVVNSYGSEEIYMYDIEIDVCLKIISLSQKLELKYQSLALKLSKFQKLFNKDLALKTYETYSLYNVKNNRFKRFQRNIYLFMQKISKHRYKRNYIGVHYRLDDVGKDIFDSTTKTQSTGLSILYDVNWVYGKYDTHAMKYIRDIRNKKATIPLSRHKPFDSLVLNEEEYRKMKYKNFDRILDSINGITPGIKEKPLDVKFDSLDVTPSEVKYE